MVVRDGVILGEGANLVTSTNDPSAHAEIIAIRQACQKLRSFELRGCEIYSSCEPCPMCLGAIYWARLASIYFAASKDDASQSGFDDSFIYQEFSRRGDQRKIPMVRIMSKQSSGAFSHLGTTAEQSALLIPGQVPAFHWISEGGLKPSPSGCAL